MAQDNLDSVVASGIPLHKAIAMGMAGEGGAGQSAGGSSSRSSTPNVKEDLGAPERKPGMAGKSDKY